MTNNELTWRLVERIEALASGKPSMTPFEFDDREKIIDENDKLRRELSEVKAKHDILLHESDKLNEALSEEMRQRTHSDEIIASMRNPKLSAVMDKVHQAVNALGCINDDVAKAWTFMASGDASIMLPEIREAIGWVRPEVKAP